MKFTATILAAACLIALVSSIPVPESEGLQSQALDRLVMVEDDNDAALRSKRTIGILRQLFPGISQMIENKVNMIVGEVIKVLGPTLLRGALGGGGRQNSGGGGGESGKSSDDGSTVTVKSPFDDDDDDDEPISLVTSDGTDTSMSKSAAMVSISLPTYPPDEDDETTVASTTAKARDEDNETASEGRKSRSRESSRPRRGSSGFGEQRSASAVRRSRSIGERSGAVGISSPGGDRGERRREQEQEIPELRLRGK